MRLLHRAFQGGIALKGLMGAIEATLGTGLLLTGHDRLHRWIDAATRWDLIEDRSGVRWARIANAAEAFSAGSQHFYALYLLAHGVAKLVMVAMLWRGVRAAFPIAIALQVFFVTVELARWADTGGPVIAALAALDFAVMVLIALEWRRRPAAHA